MTLDELRAQWTARASELEPYAPAAAEAFRRAAAELRDALTDAGETVTLREAHKIGGYSVDHLQRLVASGDIENVGRVGKPRIRRADVPVKPGHLVLQDDRPQRQLSASAVVDSAITRSET